MDYYNIRRVWDGMRIAIVLCDSESAAIRRARVVLKLRGVELNAYKMRCAGRIASSNVGELVSMPDGTQAIRIA
jgi:hypothetical protein